MVLWKVLKNGSEMYEMAGCGVRKCAHFRSSLLHCDLIIMCGQVDSDAVRNTSSCIRTSNFHTCREFIYYINN